MKQNKLRVMISFVIAIILFCPGLTYGNTDFDFGLPLFGFEEIRFEKNKTPGFNIQLLKKFLLEHKNSPLHQLHGINRWFKLFRLSGASEQKELEKLSTEFFSTDKKNVSDREIINEIYFRGLLLSQDKSPDPNSKKDQEFENLLLNAEDKVTENSNYWIVKGLVFYLLHNRPSGYFLPMKPQEDFKRAVAIIPKEAIYYYTIGQAFRMLGNDDTSLFLSIACYEHASSIEPRNPRLQNSLLSIYMGLHEDFQSKDKPEPFWLEEAVYKKILSISPNNPYALNNLGYLYAEYGVNAKLSLELCQRAVNISMDNPTFRDSLGWAAFKNQNFEKAEAELKKSLSLRSNVYEPYYHLGTVYYAWGKWELAAEQYSQAVAIRPDSAEVLNNFAYLLTEQDKQIDLALSYSEKAVRMEPNNASYLDTLGCVYYRLGNFEKALKYLKKASDIAPGESEILLHIGRVLLEQNNFIKAIGYLREAYKHNPALVDPDASLYIAICLKAYHSALAEYHRLLGANADKEKIISILMSIARLYQEEKLYDKSIEITKLCSGIKNGEHSLSEAIFSSYQLKKTREKNREPKINLEDSITEAEGEESSSESSEAREPEDSEESLIVKLPPVTDYPLIISIGPEFFRLVKAFVSGLEVFEDKSVTLFLRNFYKPTYSAILRIESESAPGILTMELLGRFLTQCGSKQVTSTPDSLELQYGNKKLFLKADATALYISKSPIQGVVDTELLGSICQYSPDTLSEIIYDWRALQNLFPSLLKLFVVNPLKPFIHIYTRYTWQDDILREFSVATSGKAEDEEFAKRFSRRLLSFKLLTKKMGINTTIRFSIEDELVYISIDFEEIEQWFKSSDTGLGSMLMPFLRGYINRSQCFFNRLFLIPGKTSYCLDNGEMLFSGENNIVECSIHENLPSIPIFLSDKDACRFSRDRLEKYMKKNKVENKMIDKELSSLAKRLDIPLCLLSGTWSNEAGESIKCSGHD